jgi:hypothetical protein
VEKLDQQSLPGLIRDLQAELRARPAARSRPLTQRHEIARQRIAAPHEILDWAIRDERWSYTLAEVMAGAVGRPRDLAARLVVAIVDELQDEDDLLAAEITTAT